MLPVRSSLRRLLATGSWPAPRLVEDADTLQRMVRESLPDGAPHWRAFYSSSLGPAGEGGAIVKDPAFFALPLDDHGVHRGHAVFDTCNVKGGKCFGLDFHLDRFLASAVKARIEHSFDRAWLKDAVLRTIAAGGRRDDVLVRYWMTAGRGGFGISPRGSVPDYPRPSFYCVVHDYATNKGGASQPGLREALVYEDDVPFKPPLLASCKNTNYLLNALMTMRAEDLGGTMGIGVDRKGFVTESNIANVAIVTPDGRRLLTPPFDGRVLEGTTARRALDIAPHTLVTDGVIASADFAPITAGDVLAAREVIFLGGGSCSPVIEVDGHPIGTGGPGPVFKALSTALSEDMATCGAVLHDIPYHLYEGGEQDEART